MKNIMGYGLNVLFDFEDFVCIFEYLIIGFEGMFVFVVEVCFWMIVV